MGKICCFTGHREIEAKYLVGMCAWLDRCVERLVERGYDEFRAGGALGFDTFAALSVIKAKRNNPHIKLVLMLPCRDQDKYWNGKEKALYEYVKSHADEITYSRERYRRGVMNERNRALVDGSDACVAFLKKKRGGTSYTCGYAEKRGLTVFNIYKKLRTA